MVVNSQKVGRNAVCSNRCIESLYSDGFIVRLLFLNRKNNVGVVSCRKATRKKMRKLPIFACFVLFVRFQS